MRHIIANKLFFSILGTIIVIGCISHYSTTTETKKAEEFANSYSRGKNLAFNICGQCHYNETEKRFIGKLMGDLPDFMGDVYSANLTHSIQYGVLTKYTDAELAYLLKTGINREGKYVPWMPRPNLADTDINDITIFLRSNDSAVMAVDKLAGKTEISLLGKIGTRIAGKPFPYKKGIEAPDKKDSIAYGKYLIDNLACYHCHSKSIMGLDYLQPEKSKGYMAGGMRFKTSGGKKIYSANLSPDNETGIGNYTKYDFRKILQRGLRPEGDSIHLPMQKFKHLANKQSDAIYYYLKSLKPVKNKLKK
ncbi:MAG TPA: hypothetical protein VNZ49_11010 [Bacteroidia bacterium]|jgi:hypothetical protein|nr:hypothetical protein [Bacteroidia bacterium]